MAGNKEMKMGTPTIPHYFTALYGCIVLTAPKRHAVFASRMVKFISLPLFVYIAPPPVCPRLDTNKRGPS